MQIKKPKPDLMCKPGFHLVRGHQRTCQTGTKTWVDAHIAKNPGSRIDILLSENILWLYWTSKEPVSYTHLTLPTNREV